MSWAAKRQLIGLCIILGIGLTIGLFIIVPKLTQKPTCTDGSKNGEETGVDCGGTCQNFCPAEVNSLVTLWSRSFKVSNNLYNAVAYVENQNPNAALKSIRYEFKLYDANSVFIASRTGSTFIAPNGRTPIFEPSINVGNRVVSRTVFTFLDTPTWVKVPRGILEKLPIVSRDNKLSGLDTTPKLESTIVNESLYDVSDLEVVGILYDVDGNVIAVSKTSLDMLPKNSNSKVFFTWPNVFDTKPVSIDVIPRINIFSVNF